MGLLDQVLGQVLGGGTATQPSSSQGHGGQGGGLGGLLSGNRGPIAMALLALLASKHLNNGAGGYGSALHDMFSGGTSTGAAAGGSNASGGGGLLDKLSGMFGGSGADAPPMGDGLGSLLGGGVTGGALASGFGDLLSRFNQAGHGSIANSWIGSGPNAPISPDQLGQVLDPSDVEELSRQTGLGRGDLLSQLSSALPQVVDKLTPQGRLPSADEHAQWV